MPLDTIIRPGAFSPISVWTLELVAMIEPVLSTTVPSIAKSPPTAVPSIRKIELVISNTPPLVMEQPLTINGVPRPALFKNSVLVLLTGADTTTLLTVIVDGKLPEVVASMVTVLLPALVMVSPGSKEDGATVRDQLLLVSHLPVPSTQVLVRPEPMAVTAGERILHTTRARRINTAIRTRFRHARSKE